MLVTVLIVIIVALLALVVLAVVVDNAKEYRLRTVKDALAACVKREDSLENDLDAADSRAEALVDISEGLQAQLKKVTSQKKSSEVRTGLIVEQMAPFLDGFPYDPKLANFMARPLDFVVFDDSGVHFVEVKSGEAKLSSKQRKIRDQISRGEVSFEVYRIKGG